MRVRSDVKKHVSILLIVLGLILVFAFVFFLISKWEARNGSADITDPDSQAYQPGALCIDDKWYVPKADITTVLGIGIDKFQSETSNDSYNNIQRADFLMLLILDRKNDSYKLIHINRDTMADIPVLGIFGDPAGSFPGQLALSHTYGSGGKDSCQNTVKAISDFLLGARIDHYVSFTMDVVPKITDSVGGVTLTLLDDFTMIDPAMKKGTEFTLTGEKALAYVRARKLLDDATNIKRMKRQRQFLSALKEKTSGCVFDDEDFIKDMMKILSEYVVSDCTVNQLAEFGDDVAEWSGGEIIKIPGEAKTGEKYIEFYADENALKDIVLSLLYEPCPK